MIRKQNELITESALEDLLKCIWEKKYLFCISLPICCFQKAASLRGFGQVLWLPPRALHPFIIICREYFKSPSRINWIQISSQPFCVLQNWMVLSSSLKGFVFVCVHNCDNWQELFFRGRACMFDLRVNCFRVSWFLLKMSFTKMTPSF